MRSIETSHCALVRATPAVVDTFRHGLQIGCPEASLKLQPSLIKVCVDQYNNGRFESGKETNPVGTLKSSLFLRPTPATTLVHTPETAVDPEVFAIRQAKIEAPEGMGLFDGSGSLIMDVTDVLPIDLTKVIDVDLFRISGAEISDCVGRI